MKAEAAAMVMEQNDRFDDLELGFVDASVGSRHNPEIRLDGVQES